MQDYLKFHRVTLDREALHIRGEDTQWSGGIQPRQLLGAEHEDSLGHNVHQRKHWRN